MLLGILFLGKWHSFREHEENRGITTISNPSSSSSPSNKISKAIFYSFVLIKIINNCNNLLHIESEDLKRDHVTRVQKSFFFLLCIITILEDFYITRCTWCNWLLLYFAFRKMNKGRKWISQVNCSQSFELHICNGCADDDLKLKKKSFKIF